MKKLNDVVERLFTFQNLVLLTNEHFDLKWRIQITPNQVVLPHQVLSSEVVKRFEAICLDHEAERSRMLLMPFPREYFKEQRQALEIHEDQTLVYVLMSHIFILVSRWLNIEPDADLRWLSGILPHGIYLEPRIIVIRGLAAPPNVHVFPQVSAALNSLTRAGVTLFRHKYLVGPTKAEQEAELEDQLKEAHPILDWEELDPAFRLELSVELDALHRALVMALTVALWGYVHNEIETQALATPSSS